MNDAANGCASEETEQICLMRWAQLESGKYPELKMLFHIPNGGKRGKAEAGRFKAMGGKPGVPDLFLPVARRMDAYGTAYHGLFVEMKRQKGGRVSREQREWMERLRQNGYAVLVCRGWEEATECIQKYLEGRWV